MGDLARRRVLGLGLAGSVVALLGAHGAPSDDLPEETVRRGGIDEQVRIQGTIDDDDIAYIGDGTVEYVATQRGGEPVSNRTTSFVEWGDRRCGDYAARAVETHVRETLELGYGPLYTLRFGTGEPIDSELNPGVLVEYEIQTRDGEVRKEPPVGYETVVEAAPRTAAATVELDGHAYECTYPVWVQRVVRAAPVPD